MTRHELTAIIEREGDLFIARCVHFGIARQGRSRAAALADLKQAVELVVANTDDADTLKRLDREIQVKRFEVERP